MNINLSSYEVIDSILAKISQKYGINVDSEAVTEAWFKCQEMEYTYQKHKNGRLKKDEHGCKIIDNDKSKWITKTVDFNGGELHLYFD